jgi:hypothetical protein
MNANDAKKATPDKDLYKSLMDPNISKNELEHFARRKIQRLESHINKLEELTEDTGSCHICALDLLGDCNEPVILCGDCAISEGKYHDLLIQMLRNSLKIILEDHRVPHKHRQGSTIHTCEDALALTITKEGIDYEKC